MKPDIRLIEDENYPEDDIAPEYDFADLHRRAQAEGREYRGILSGRIVRLAPDVSEVFTTAEAVNEALRRVIAQDRDAA